MGRKYTINNPAGCYFVTFTTVFWLDIFTRTDYKTILVNSLRHCQEHKQLELRAWCLMTNHAHLILSTPPDISLSDVIRDLKKYTSYQVRRAIETSPVESRKEWLVHVMKNAAAGNKNNTTSQLWQQHNHPIELSTPTMAVQRLNYVHNNPVEAGFVDNPWEWRYSSARDYATQQTGLLPISFL